MRNRQSVHWGMTLVELLVVVVIIVLLLAISVPMLKPVLESRKTSNAAQVLAGVFRQARTKAIKEGLYCGVRLSPFETAPTAVVRLPLKREGVSCAVNPPNVRVKVDHGTIVFYCFDTTTWEWKKPSEISSISTDLQADLETAQTHFEGMGEVQFNRLGRSLRFHTTDSGIRLFSPYTDLVLPEDISSDAMEYRISKRSGTSMPWFPPVVMPHETIVDLVFSGGEEVVPIAFSAWDEVVVVFSPAGYVDYIEINGKQTKVNEMLYFCVGEWDRQIDANDATKTRTLAEDGRTNLQSPATYWVTLHPKTGGIRITENAPIRAVSATLKEQLQDARKFAREHFFDVGGQ